MKRFNEKADQAELNKCPEPNRDETILLSVKRNSVTKVLHWRIAWKAYNAKNECVGHKTLEIKHDNALPAGSAQRFMFRFSVRGITSNTADDWVSYELGKLSLENRRHLWTSAEDWDGEGNCIAFTREAIEQSVDSGHFGGEAGAKIALQKIQEAKRKDIEARIPVFNEVHNSANNSLEERRAKSWYKHKDGVLKKLEKSGDLAKLLK